MTDAATTSGPGVRQRLLWAAILASFVSFLDGSIVNIALPAIRRDLGGGLETQQWVIDGYLLTLSAVILIAGSVSDRFGRLRVLRIAIVAFAVTSILCGLSPSSGFLIGARLAQGVAGALLVPGSLALVIATFDGEEQARAIGRWMGWTSVSFLAGPIVGGLLVDGLGWRWVFFLSALPAAAGLLLLGRLRDDRRGLSTARFDLTSAALTAIGLGGITVGLIEQQRLGFGDPLVLGALAAGVAALIGFVLWDRRAGGAARADGPVPLAQLRRRQPRDPRHLRGARPGGAGAAGVPAGGAAPHRHPGGDREPAGHRAEHRAGGPVRHARRALRSPLVHDRRTPRRRSGLRRHGGRRRFALRALGDRAGRRAVRPGAGDDRRAAHRGSARRGARVAQRHRLRGQQRGRQGRGARRHGLHGARHRRHGGGCP